MKGKLVFIASSCLIFLATPLLSTWYLILIYLMHIRKDILFIPPKNVDQVNHTGLMYELQQLLTENTFKWAELRWHWLDWAGQCSKTFVDFQGTYLWNSVWSLIDKVRRQVWGYLPSVAIQWVLEVFFQLNINFMNIPWLSGGLYLCLYWYFYWQVLKYLW